MKAQGYKESQHKGNCSGGRARSSKERTCRRTGQRKLLDEKLHYFTIDCRGYKNGNRASN